MFSTIIFNIPFFIFYFYAISVSLEKRKVQQQPATLSLIVFSAFLGKAVIVFILVLLLQRGGGGEGASKSLYQVMIAIHYVLMALLMFCIFGWRKSEEATYKRPIKLTVVGFVLIGVGILFSIFFQRMFVDGGFNGDIKLFAGFNAFFSMIFGLGSLIFFLKAIFDSRGYPEAKPAVVTAGQGNGSSADQINVQVPLTGLFEEKDFIPYVVGIMGFGGLLIIPLLWGGFMGMGYERSMFPALLSCGIFAFSHDKRGNFLWGRFIFLSIYVFFMIMRTAAKYGGGGKPMFLAGGFLGYVVMFGCGWLGIAINRFLFKKK